ncbi:type II secretion system protein G (GspG) [Cupriavidus plantarum]|uniref:Type II secretion system protein G (GspG) n=2 Tax=Cupriavidus plantarum TaxID=942865 RepID=A0A316EVE9_9BURK|nr:prepilin-type N-terminal cleavage/methylation domain-containing protein [Cupriavidus plantarum]PWK35149.1 type II secretion system protein G (GspG) [Cupriavidus plantarum]REE93594.1 type II secretion system protein G (GspG) [Cupriavidus plantarum]RLK39016.1 type II secretion system protein G (GspG) [Cupriavidus plantarum]
MVTAVMRPIDLVRRGFTLIELLVVLAILATLLTLVVPRYFGQADKARETVLRENLTAMRDSIDRFRADEGRYPGSLEELVQKRYLREIPLDTVTQSRGTWKTVPAPDGKPGVYDVRSGASGKGKDGTDYGTW